MDIKTKCFLILSMLFITSTISDILWLSKETVPPGWDESLHLTKSLQYYDVIMSNQWNLLIKIDDYYPPFYHLSTFIPYILFGTSTDSAIFVNIIYFGILLFSVYGIGKHFGGEQSGLIGSLLIVLYPGIVGIRRFFVIDNGVVALVALSIYLLLLSDKFKNVKFTLYFGLVSGLAVLSKWTAVFFIIPPFLVVCYDSFVKNKKMPPVAFYCMAILGVVVCLTWYWEHFMDVYTKISWGNVYWGTMEGDPDVFSIESFLYYGKSLINAQISFFFFLLFLIGAIKYRNQVLLLSWIIVPYVVMTLMKNKNERYTLPSIAAVAIITALWIASIKTKQTKTVIIATVLIVGAGQLLILGLIPEPTPLMVGGIAITPGQIYGTRPPMTDNWHTEDIVSVLVDDIGRNSRIKGRTVHVATVVDSPYINGLTVGYYAYMKHLNVNSISVTDFEASQPFIDNYYRFDYLIIKNDKYHMTGRKDMMIEMNNYFNEHKTGWTPIGTFDLPDMTNLTLYKNTMVTI